jgi:hypothetical protein
MQLRLLTGPDDTRVNIEQRWNDTDRGKPKDSWQNLSHSVHHMCSISHSTNLHQLLFGRAMAQAVSLQTFTAETRVRTRVNPCGIFGGKSGTGSGFPPSCQYYSVSYHRGSTVMCHLVEKQHIRWWPQFRDIVPPPQT